MKHDKIIEEIESRLSQLYRVKAWFENDKLTDENNRLKEENKELKLRNSQLEHDKVRPFTLNSFDPTVSLHDIEKQYTLNALKHFKGDKIQAAEALGLTIKTLYNNLHMYGE